MKISTSIKKGLLVSVSTLSAVGFLAAMPLVASAQLTPGSSQMTPKPNANQPGSTGVIRDDAAVESSQMEGNMMTPGSGTRTNVPGANNVGGETTGEVGTGTSVPINSSQTGRDSNAAQSSELEQNGGTMPGAGTSTNTNGIPSTINGDTTGEIGTGTNVPINPSQTGRDSNAAQSSQLEQNGGMAPGTGTVNTSPNYSSPTYSSPTYSSPTPTTATPSTTTPAASTNRSPRALW